MHIDYPDLDATAVRTSVALVKQLTPADLARPTPCAGWNLAGLLAHMTAQHHGFAAGSTGDGDLAPWQPKPLGADPIAEYEVAADRVLTAFAAEGVLDREFCLPESSQDYRFPATMAMSFHLVDYVVHSWDVARTLGLPVEFDAAVLTAALAVAEAVPDGAARLAPAAPFAPAVTWSGGSTLDRIVALLGRSPGWTA